MRTRSNMHHGDGAAMSVLADGEADMVITSPPYWPDELSVALTRPSKEQTNFDQIHGDIIAFARSLRPVFAEVGRVLRPGRACIIQTKDIRYGSCLVPLSDTHASVANTCGLYLHSRIIWIPSVQAPWRVPPFVRSPRVGNHRTTDGEQFLVMCGPAGLGARGKLDLNPELARALVCPVWSQRSRPKKGDHPHGSPRPVVKQLIQLYSEEGDLVVDPFAGGGTVLEVAESLGRRAIGWEIRSDLVAGVKGPQ